MTVCMVISLPKIPYIPRNVWFWPTQFMYDAAEVLNKQDQEDAQ